MKNRKQGVIWLYAVVQTKLDHHGEGDTHGSGDTHG
jgi:hypothetical protein